MKKYEIYRYFHIIASSWYCWLGHALDSESQQMAQWG